FALHGIVFFFIMVRSQPRPTLFPYTTLFRSIHAHVGDAGVRQTHRGRGGPQREHGDGPADGEARRQRPDHGPRARQLRPADHLQDRKSTRLNSSHRTISYAVFCLKKKIRSSQPCYPSSPTSRTPSPFESRPPITSTPCSSMYPIASAARNSTADTIASAAAMRLRD